MTKIKSTDEHEFAPIEEIVDDEATEAVEVVPGGDGSVEGDTPGTFKDAGSLEAKQ